MSHEFEQTPVEAGDPSQPTTPVSSPEVRTVARKPGNRAEPEVRPEILAIFDAHWERHEPAYRFLAEH